jgi:hypothetical protein
MRFICDLFALEYIWKLEISKINGKYKKQTKNENIL